MKKNYSAFLIMILFMFSSVLLIWGEEEKNAIFEDLKAAEFTEKIRSMEESFMIIDVRTPEEFAMERIKGSVNINFYDKSFENEIKKLDKEKKYFIYCRSGNRSGQTLRGMSKLGFQEVYNLEWGIGSDQQHLDIER